MKNIVVLTGAALDGIGEAVLRKLIFEGYKVIGSYELEYKNKASSLLAEFPELQLIEVDHSNRSSLKNFTETVKQNEIIGLVNAQMFFEMELSDEFDYEVWDKSLAVNLTAPNFLFHELKNVFKMGASIIVITSTEGFTGSFGASAYAATKAAIHNLVKTHANLSGSKQLRVNALAAGWIGGVMDTDEIFNMSKKITPLKRLGSPEEIANVVSFLLSDKSTFLNGTVITADGGYSGVDAISKYEYEENLKNTMNKN